MSFAIGISFGAEAILVADTRVCDLRDDGSFVVAGERQRKVRVLRSGALLLGGYSGDELVPLLGPRAPDLAGLRRAAASVRKRLQQRGVLDRLATAGLLTVTVAAANRRGFTLRALDLATGDAELVPERTPLLVAPAELDGNELRTWVTELSRTIGRADDVFTVLRIAAAEARRLCHRFGVDGSVGPDLAGLVLRARAGTYEFGATSSAQLVEASEATLEAALRSVRWRTSWTAGPRVPSAPLHLLERVGEVV